MQLVAPNVYRLSGMTVGNVYQLDATVVCFGHGKPLTQDTGHILRRFAQKVGAG
jgi:hypothetical protein